jgi:hypothetical protein
MNSTRLRLVDASRVFEIQTESAGVHMLGLAFMNSPD